MPDRDVHKGLAKYGCCKARLAEKVPNMRDATHPCRLTHLKDDALGHKSESEREGLVRRRRDL